MNCLEILTEIQESTKEVYIASDYTEYCRLNGIIIMLGVIKNEKR